ncbi:response regulator transcription factor [Actinoplanes sp. CA-051413]|uniref:response regulator transcription factor n=1 Tax=Actinoplanes sp. CA-051413 TaxID=3239899 RepID=UPI003D967765
MIAATDLPARQQQVLRLVAEGLTDRQVGERLGIAEGTARNHLYRAGQTLGFHTRTHAAVLAFEHGLLEAAA